MARRRNPDSLSRIFLRLALAAGFGLFCGFHAIRTLSPR